MDAPITTVLSFAALVVQFTSSWRRNDSDWEQTRSRRLALYVASIVTLALGVLIGAHRVCWPSGQAFSVPTLLEVWAGTEHDPLERISLWLLITSIVSTVSIRLPSGDAKTSAASICDVAAVAVLGPAGAIVVAALTDLVSNVRKPLVRVIFNVAQVILSVGLAASAFRLAMWLVAETGIPSPFTGQGLIEWLAPLVILVPASVYYLANTYLVSLVVHFDTGAPRSAIWNYNYGWQAVLVPFMLVPFSTSLAVSWVHDGWIEEVLAGLSAIAAQFAVVGVLQKRGAAFEVIRTLAAEADRTDPSTVGQSQRLAAYSVQIAWALRLSQSATRDLEFAAWIHNFGALAQKHAFVLRTDLLTSEQRVEVEQHPRIAYELIKDLDGLSGAAEILLCHQEHPDGSGYPRKLCSPDIPLGSLILHTAEAFDSMVTGRPYGGSRSPVSTSEACELLRRKAGKEFDARAVEVLVGLHQAGHLRDRLGANDGLAATARFAVRVLSIDVQRIARALPHMGAAWNELHTAESHREETVRSSAVQRHSSRPSSLRPPSREKS